MQVHPVLSLGNGWAATERLLSAPRPNYTSEDLKQKAEWEGFIAHARRQFAKFVADFEAQHEGKAARVFSTCPITPSMMQWAR